MELTLAQQERDGVTLAFLEAAMHGSSWKMLHDAASVLGIKELPTRRKTRPIAITMFDFDILRNKHAQEKQRQSLTVLKLEATLENLEKDKNPTTAKGLITKKTKFCSWSEVPKLLAAGDDF